MCDGTLKSIVEVEIGDSVLARSKLTGEIECREVMNLSEPAERSIILVTLESMDGTSEVIATTENHPFFVEGLGWTRVDDLVPGDLVPSATNGLLTVSALEWTDRIEVVYNFGVDEFHTYFVGAVGAWVHNCNFEEIARHVIEDRGRFVGKTHDQVVNYFKNMVRDPKTKVKVVDDATIYRRNQEILISRGEGGTYFKSDTTAQAKRYFERFK